ncbi:hypothetical protein Q5P01_026342 [Channa striata]|uniref:Thioredoxin-like fold domain-containing protein n=1 Tax=Channa striata TaxID=64152 RepID=A0AA88IZR4_CHASR|nr:hypothetical protein Q5P01_026342 [Channa striata]
MVDLFSDRVLVKNNKEQDELDTEREIVMRLQNRILMLFFASAACESCQQFAPTLKDFFKRLTDEFYVDRSAQLVLLYISLDQSDEQQEILLKELPRKCLFLAFEDPYRRELETMFNVEQLPTVVVLRPDCSILIPNAVEEIRRLGPDCYRNWQEAAELIDRNFMVSEDFQEKSMRSFSDPVRRLKYKLEEEKEKEKKKKKKCRKDAEVDGGADGKEEGGGSPWTDQDGSSHSRIRPDVLLRLITILRGYALITSTSFPIKCQDVTEPDRSHMINEPDEL